MLNIKNLRKQVIYTEKKQDDKHVLLVIPARETVSLDESELSEDIKIKNQRGDLLITSVEAPPPPADPQE